MPFLVARLHNMLNANRHIRKLYRKKGQKKMEERAIILKQIEILQAKQEQEGLLVDELIRLSGQITLLLSLLDEYSTTE